MIKNKLRTPHRAIFKAVLPAALTLWMPLAAQTQDAATNPTNSAVRLPDVIVTGRKTPEREETVPASDTAVTRTTLQADDAQTPKDASIYAPNVFLSEFTARAQSVPYFRGIGGGLGYNPGVTTFIDGVPQLNFYSANIELLGVNQVEFLRGPQGNLFGRNTAGGVINITSTRPTDYWTGGAVGSFGNFDYGDFRGSISGPIVKDNLDISLDAGYSSRDGYTTDQTGRGIDGRLAGFGKGQLLYHPTERLELRLIMRGEHDADGDYALGQLNEMRSHPRIALREAGPDLGYNHRDLAAAVLQVNYKGEAVDVSSISGGGGWRNAAYTDWDYAGAYTPLVAALGSAPFYENNVEQQWQLTQEFRAASPKENPVHLADPLDLRWQSGVFVFGQSYHQTDAKKTLGYLGTASLGDVGAGVYGQGKLTAWDHLDFTAALRYDFEHKSANLNTTEGKVFFSAKPSADFGEISPEFDLDWRYSSNQMTYLRLAEGYKAGGFNPLGPPFEYGPEHTWNYELGHKAIFLDGKLDIGADIFYIDWSHIQEGQLGPPPFYNYFIVNSGGADSKGVELQATYRPLRGWDLFGSVGYTDARFQNNAVYLDAPIPNHLLPNTPIYTGNGGTQLSWAPCRAVTLYARAEVTVYGGYQYDASNVAGQNAFSIASFRAGIKGRHWFAEGWVNNAFNNGYVPIAFDLLPLPGSTGYVGESGPPRTFGFRGGIMF